MAPAHRDHRTVAAEVNALVDEYRLRCLWFLREDFYPSNHAERLQVLDSIERHGDRAAFQRAATLTRWLSQNPSEPSVAS